jgi:hypothetical protein
MAKIFISYRRGHNQGEARSLASDLSKYVGKNKVFLDVDNIQPGLDFRQILQGSLLRSNCLLALIGPDWLDVEDPETKKRRLENPDDFVRKEIAAALKRKIPVTPVLLRDARMPAQEELPDDLKELAFREGFALRHQRWDDDVRELARRLRLVSRSPLAKLCKTITGAFKVRTLAEVAAAFVFLLVVRYEPPGWPLGQVHAEPQPENPQPLPEPPRDQSIEGEVVGNFLTPTPPVVWMSVTGKDGKAKPTPLTLYGVKDVDPKIEQLWLAKHPEKLSCRVVSSNPDPSYRCLAANTFDLSEALLLNGGAMALPDAPPS